MNRCRDPYTEYAAKLFAVPEGKVTADQRKQAKCALFCELYSPLIPFSFAPTKRDTKTHHKEQQVMEEQQVINEKLERVAEILESWAEGQLLPPEQDFGIGGNLMRIPGSPLTDGEELVARAAQSWSEFSGGVGYPVPHEHVSPESAYTAVLVVHKWGDDAYGQARRRLCQHVADWIRENPEEALSFVRGA